ncbi:MAG: hypothetical protein QOF14_4785 [Hyphomicrobiales bacterium]|jgi:hypothetical protein|nr:hypothetical protein [Hyphomicrobiales bacterium]
MYHAGSANEAIRIAVVTREQAIAIARQIGPPALKFAASIVAPLYWVGRNPDGTLFTRNGTAFFLQTHEALFGVTAAHVIEGENSWRNHCEQYGRTPVRLGGREGTSVQFDWDARCVDINLDMDIATFMVSPREVQQINRTIYSGLQTRWPPDPPAEKQGIMYAGFPGHETRQLSRLSLQFGIACGAGLVDSVSPRNVSSLIEREYLEPALGQGIPPENYDYGGISGGPMLYNLLTTQGIFVTALAGVIYSGPNISEDQNQAISGFELFRARPATYIRADGFLEHDLWAQSQ